MDEVDFYEAIDEATNDVVGNFIAVEGSCNKEVPEHCGHLSLSGQLLFAFGQLVNHPVGFQV